MNTDADQNLKKLTLKLKTQEKQLIVVKALLNRSTGFTKSQAEATEKRLEKEITDLKKSIQSANKKK